MKKTVRFVIAILGLLAGALMFATDAFAASETATAVSNNVIDTASNFLVNVVLPAVGIAAASFFTFFIKGLAGKAGADQRTIDAMNLDAIASKAVGAVEEKAAAFIKSSAGKAKMASADKLDAAAEYIMKEVPGIDADAAKRAALAALAAIQGVGATGDNVVQ